MSRDEIKIGTVEIYAIRNNEFLSSRIACFMDPHFFSKLEPETQRLWLEMLSDGIKNYLMPDCQKGLRKTVAVEEGELEAMKKKIKALESTSPQRHVDEVVSLISKGYDNEEFGYHVLNYFKEQGLRS